MGEVWLARQAVLKKTVAIKLIRPEHLASEGARARFLSEARAAARVFHPNIVTLFEFGDHEGTLYFAMQYVEGADLAARMAERRFSARESATLLAKTARAVHHAHQNRLVHRDLKPANILVDENLEPYLTDFGVAKPLDEGPGLTRAGDLVGTPRYMAPEQAMGHETITTAVDVWGLGAILFEMLSGEPLWNGDPRTVLARLVSEEPRRLRLAGGKPDRDLETICQACLARSPERRYASAAALADDLEHWLRGEPILARPVGGMERLAKWARRHPYTAWLTGVLVAGGSFWLGLEWWRMIETRTEYHRLLMTRADAAFRSGRDTEGYATLGKLSASAPGNPAARARLQSALAYRRVAMPALPPLRDGAPLNAVAFGPDDRWLATGGAGGMVRIWNRTTGEPRGPALPVAASVFGLAFLDARRLIGFGRGGEVDAWVIEEEGVRRSWSRSLPGSVVWAEPSRDGTLVFAADATGGVSVLDATTGESRYRRTVLTNVLTAAAVSADGRFMAVGGRLGEFAVVRWADDSVTHHPGDGGMDCSRLAFAPNRGLLVLARGDGSLRKIDVTAPLENLPEVWVNAGVSAMAFTPDERRLLVGREDGEVDQVDVDAWVAAEGAPRVVHGGPVTGLAVNRDGTLVVSSDGAGEARLWDPRDRRPRSGPVFLSRWISQVTFDARGTSFAAASFDGTAGVWDVPVPRDPVVTEIDASVEPRLRLVNAVALDRNGIAAVGWENGEIRLRDLPGDGSTIPFARLPNAIQSLEFDAGGRNLLVGCADGTASLWEVGSRRRLREFRGHSGILWRAMFGPEERWVVTQGEDAIVRLWRMSDGVEEDRKMPSPLPGATQAGIVEVAMDGARTLVAVSTDARATYVWRLATPGREWMRFEYDAPHHAVALSPDGKRLAVGCKTGELLVWGTEASGRPPRVLPLPGPVKRLGWSGDGRRVAAGLTTGEVLWVADARDAEPVVLGRLSGDINVVTFTGDDGDGSRVFAASQGGEAQVWAVDDGAAWSERFAHPKSVFCAAIGPGGEWVLTGCNDGRARLWKLAWSAAGGGAWGPLAEALGKGDHATVFRHRGLVGVLEADRPGGTGMR